MSFPPPGSAIIAAPQESLNTWTTVRHMSSGQFDREHRAHNQLHLWTSQIDGLQNNIITTNPADGTPAAAIDASNDVITIC